MGLLGLVLMRFVLGGFPWAWIESLEFKFVLRPMDDMAQDILEDGPNRVLKVGKMLSGPGSFAKFELPEEYGMQSVELAVSMTTDPVSPFALAASWRALKKNLKPHSANRVRGIPDVSLDQNVLAHNVQTGLQALELDLEHYEVPPPTSSTNSGVQYAADTTETPHGLQRSASVPIPFYGESRRYQLMQGETYNAPQDHHYSISVKVHDTNKT